MDRLMKGLMEERMDRWMNEWSDPRLAKVGGSGDCGLCVDI